MSWVFAIGIVIAAWLVLAGGLKIIGIYHAAETKYAASAAKFYELAEALAANERLPERGVQLLVDMNATINKAHAARVLILALREMSGEQRSLGNRLPEVPEKLLLGLRQAYEHWFSAVTSRAPIYGSIARRLNREQEYGPVVKSVSKRVDKHIRLAHV